MYIIITSKFIDGIRKILTCNVRAAATAAVVVVGGAAAANMVGDITAASDWPSAGHVRGVPSGAAFPTTRRRRAPASTTATATAAAGPYGGRRTPRVSTSKTVLRALLLSVRRAQKVSSSLVRLVLTESPSRYTVHIQPTHPGHASVRIFSSTKQIGFFLFSFLFFSVPIPGFAYTYAIRVPVFFLRSSRASIPVTLFARLGCTYTRNTYLCTTHYRLRCAFRKLNIT